MTGGVPIKMRIFILFLCRENFGLKIVDSGILIFDAIWNYLEFLNFLRKMFFLNFCDAWANYSRGLLIF